MGPYAYGSANVTPEKAAQLQSLREFFLKDITPLQNELFAKRTEMRTLWSSANPDEGQITALQRDMQGLQGQLQEKRLQFNLEARKLLNP
jgi:zinc resistance-associated protein